MFINIGGRRKPKKQAGLLHKRVNISSGSKLEQQYGYSRAVRIGNTVYIAGTVGMNYATGGCSIDPLQQLEQAISNIDNALRQAGASLTDVVQLTTYVSSQAVFTAIASSLEKHFGKIRPTNTAVIVQFPLPDIMLEIAAIAVIGDEGC